MATPTSSSNRSKRKGTKPITQGQNPQRGNRQKVSTANVTNSSGRTNTGTAKVTTGKGSKPPAPKALPPGSNGGPLATQGRAPLRGQPQLPPGRRGGAVERSGPTVDVKANTQKLNSGSGRPSQTPQSPALPRGTSGGALTRTSGTAAKPSGRIGPLGVGRLNAAAAVLSVANAVDDARLTPAQLKEKYRVVDPNRGQRLVDRMLGGNKQPVNKDANGRSSQGVTTPKGRTVATGSQRYNDYRNQQIAAERERLKGVGNPPAKAKPPAPTQDRGGSTQSRGSSGGGSAPRRPTPAPQTTQTGPKPVSASTYNREQGNYGTSRTNNPMIDAEMKARMRQREDQQGVGPLKDGARYAADVKNNTQGVGPVNNADTYSSALKQKSGSEKLKDAIAKQRDEQQRLKRKAG